jgi:hypothetical protein
MEEIEKKYDGYWVCLTNIKEGEYHETLGGEVALASKNKNEVIKRWAGPHEGMADYRYFGSLPEGFGGFLL